jgi:hypothetical protein
MNKVTIYPKLAPRDWLDVFVGVSVAALYVVGPLSLYAVMRVVLSEPAASALALGLLTGWWVVFIRSLSLQIRGLELTLRGIGLIRKRGSPTFLEWGRIQEIRRATRKEMISEVRLRPGLGVRRWVPGWTTSDCYLIRWAGGRCYFPVPSARDFEELLERMRGHVEPAVSG